MNDRRALPTPLQLASLALVSMLVAVHWASLVTSPPIERLVAASLAPIGAGMAVRVLAGRFGTRPPAMAIAILAAVIGAGAMMVATGLEARLLLPGNHDEFAASIHLGVEELGDARYPYHAETAEARLVILLGLALPMAIAWFAACAPTRRLPRARAALPAVLLAASFGVAITLYSPEAPILHGAALFVGLAGWLTRPAPGRRSALAAAALVAGAGSIAVPAATALDRERPLIDYTKWAPEDESSTTFSWNHDYGNIDWPRLGEEMLSFETEQAHYWRAVVLDHFDGVFWIRRTGTTQSLELPADVEDEIETASLDSRWLVETTVEVGKLDSLHVIGPGTPLRVNGPSTEQAPDGTTFASEPLASGDSYEMYSYAPTPGAAELEGSSGTYPEVLAPYTSLNVPLRIPPRLLEGIPAPARNPTTSVTIGPGLGAPVPPAVAESPYGPVAELATRLTADAEGPLAAARAIESHLERTGTYAERTGEHDNPLAAFILRERRGFCQQFSGAMALMLRLVGVPARVVAGFGPGEALGRGGEPPFEVSDLDAHSWVEVYFNGIGWVTFDPTPAGTPASRDLTRDLGSAGRSAPADRTGDLRREFEGRADSAPAGAFDTLEKKTPWWPVPLVLSVIAASFAAAAMRRLRRFRAAGLGPAGEAQANELAGVLAGRGYDVGDAATLTELAERLRRLGYSAAARYAFALRDARYAAHEGSAPAPPGLSERRSVRAELMRGASPAARLAVLAGMPPGAPRVG